MSGDVDTFAGLAIKKSNGIGVTVIICIPITFVLLHRQNKHRSLSPFLLSMPTFIVLRRRPDSS